MLVNETKNRRCAASQPSSQQAAHSDDIAISVKNLTKEYRIFGHPDPIRTGRKNIYANSIIFFMVVHVLNATIG